MAMERDILDQFVEAVRRYTRERLVPLEDQVADEDCIPQEVIEEIREMGLFGLTTPP